MKVLALSDMQVPFIYGPQVRSRFQGTQLILGCGDLAYYYLEFVFDVLEAPLYFVRGNHDQIVEYSSAGQRTSPHGGIDLHRRVIPSAGLLLAGIEGSLKYRPGRFQYTQGEMWRHVFRLLPAMFANRLVHGRYLDIFVTHSPAAGVHDADDLPHQGIKAFRWLVNVFQPAYYFHGHIHIHRPDTTRMTRLGRTQVINAYGFYELDLDLPG